MTSTAVLDYPSVFDEAESAAVSREAEHVRSLFSDARDRFLESVFLGGAKAECKNELFEACANARLINWDGYDAQPAQAEAVSNALEFIDVLPHGIPTPEVSVDPDGEISFDWCGGRRRQFSISIGANNVLSYAGLFGADRVRGSERFQGVLPRTLIAFAKRAAQ